MKKRLMRLIGRETEAPPLPEVIQLPQADQPMSFESAVEGDDIIRLLEPADAERLRMQFLSGRMQKNVEKCFGDFPDVVSMTLLVAQYWDDEAVDAVHCYPVWSELPTPDLEAAAAVADEDLGDDVNLSGQAQWSLRSKHDPAFIWNSNGHCVSLFAPFCVEGGHQGSEFFEFKSPLVIYRRTGPESVKMEFVGEQVRPWLDGVSFDFAWSEGEIGLAEFEAWVERG